MSLETLANIDYSPTRRFVGAIGLTRDVTVDSSCVTTAFYLCVLFLEKSFIINFMRIKYLNTRKLWHPRRFINNDNTQLELCYIDVYDF